jgi:amino acid permease
MRKTIKSFFTWLGKNYVPIMVCIIILLILGCIAQGMIDMLRVKNYHEFFSLLIGIILIIVFIVLFVVTDSSSGPSEHTSDEYSDHSEKGGEHDNLSDEELSSLIDERRSGGRPIGRLINSWKKRQNK